MDFFKRIFRILFGWALVGVDSAEKASPKALLEMEKAKFNRSYAESKQALAAQKGVVHQLTEQIKVEEQRLGALKIRVADNYKAGNAERAAVLAREYEELKTEIEQNKGQLVQAEQVYEQTSRQQKALIKDAKARIERVAKKIKGKERQEALAKVAEMASDVSFDTSGGGLSALEATLDEDIALAKGKLDVAADEAEGNTWTVTESEQKALEAASLSRFAAEFGLESAPIEVEAKLVREPKALPRPQETIEAIPAEMMKAKVEG